MLFVSDRDLAKGRNIHVIFVTALLHKPPNLYVHVHCIPIHIVYGNIYKSFLGLYHKHVYPVSSCTDLSIVVLFTPRYGHCTLLPHPRVPLCPVVPSHAPPTPPPLPPYLTIHVGEWIMRTDAGRKLSTHDYQLVGKSTQSPSVFGA